MRKNFANQQNQQNVITIALVKIIVVSDIANVKIGATAKAVTFMTANKNKGD